MIQLPFDDRLAAGRSLAQELARCGIAADAIIVGIARGGVSVAYEVADRLHLMLDVVAARRIAVPWQPEITVGAVSGAERILDPPLIRKMGISCSELYEMISAEREAAAHEEFVYHQGCPILDLRCRPVVLVDDGLDSGDTMLAAVREIRRRHAGSIVAAAPVGPECAFDRLRKETDRVVCVVIPRHFIAKGEYFRNFDDVSDEQIQNLLRANRGQQARLQAMNVGVTNP